MTYYCDRHRLCELMIRPAPAQERDGAVWRAQILYCPRCGREQYLRLIGLGGETAVEKI
ncbi:endonuclease Q family protein [Feifania hominis]|uniref:Uncharacterized protein n=1 Tax=Feifania hominis TaxID=2763660 RepID=A0A926HUT3_9FIRM|nr:endonuclease Q family protein [Feifania hominis]MBC8537244.1 hypothetical protein [Feifania hominis]